MMVHSITIADRIIGPGHPPYIVAEMSGNHNQSLERALDLVVKAKEAGADAVKLQTYTADTITIDHSGSEFKIEDTLWDGRTLHELYDEAHMPWEWQTEIFAKARELGITVFSSPFDHTAIDYLETLDCPAYKIASFEIVDIPLIEKAASTGKPLVISTGMASRDEIAEAVAAARSAGGQDPAVLHCVSSYPADPADCNLLRIPRMCEEFDTVIGFSDHTLGTVTSVAAVALGASIIEKHYTIDRSEGGVDAEFSLEPHELKTLVDDCRTAQLCRGNDAFDRPSTEGAMIVFRRSLYTVEDIGQGQPLTDKNVRSIRPGHGLPPKHFKDVLGRIALRDIPRGTPLAWDDISAPGQ